MHAKQVFSKIFTLYGWGVCQVVECEVFLICYACIVFIKSEHYINIVELMFGM